MIEKNFRANDEVRSLPDSCWVTREQEWFQTFQSLSVIITVTVLAILDSELY